MNLQNQNHPTSPASPGAHPFWVSDLDLSNAVRTDACVLFTGKREVAESVARQIHELSGWRFGPFTAIDCRRPDVEIEALLAQLEKDTEPAAPESAPRPRLAQDGTVLLQEIGYLSVPAQCRIADWLAGTKDMGGRPRRRLMVSASEPLLPRVMAGTFDDRLFYRLNVIHLVVSEGGGAASLAREQ